MTLNHRLTPCLLIIAGCQGALAIDETCILTNDGVLDGLSPEEVNLSNDDDDDGYLDSVVRDAIACQPEGVTTPRRVCDQVVKNAEGTHQQDTCFAQGFRYWCAGSNSWWVSLPSDCATDSFEQVCLTDADCSDARCQKDVWAMGSDKLGVCRADPE